jgi:phosphomethylpyrimidine synthase
MTQLENARKGIVTPQMERVVRDESMEVERLVERVAGGRVVIPANINHRNIDPVGIGQGLKTKTNANIGTSGDFPRLEDELKKLDMVVACGADTVMDLSTGGDLTRIRRALIGRSRIPFGNVPVYQMAVEAVDEKTTFVERTIDDMLKCVRLQAEDGVDFMTIHAGLTQRAIEKLRKMPRRAGIVSRGGSLLTAWMIHRGEENPFYEHFDRLLDLARKYDITLSLGDGLRPGSLADATDWAQLEELMTLGELVKRSREAGVQVMVEGPGHLPLQQIEFNVQLEKQICDGAPFYVLGPLVTDIAPGYDHLTSAIGGAIAGAAGADFLCYVTPCEHLGLPDERDVRTGIYAARIAAHAADIAKGIPGALDRDRRMADARRRLAWDEQEKASIDPETFREIRGKRASSSDACSMCGDLCVYKIMEDFYR